MNKLDSLLHLIDDPDLEVYEPVKEEIIKIGIDAIDALQAVWENDTDTLIGNRVPILIHQIQFNEVKNRLKNWKRYNVEDFLEGVLVVNKYGFPNLDEEQVINQLDEIRRNVWGNMRYDLTYIDQIREINRVLFVDYNFRGSTLNHSAPENSYLSSVLERNLGNQISLAVIYLAVTKHLGLPIYGVNLPQHFVLAFTEYNNPNDVLFYINPFNRGEIFGRASIDDFLKQLNIPFSEDFYRPCDSLSIVVRILKNLENSYSLIKNEDKVMEIKELLIILTEDE